MTCTYMVGEHTFRFNPPATSAEVLAWTVWARCIRADTAEETAVQLGQAAAEWACRYLVPAMSVVDLDAALGREPDNAFLAVINLCNAIAESAGLALEVRESIALMLDRKNEVPPEFKTELACRCRKCTAAARGVEMENLAGASCVFAGLDPAAELVASAISQFDDLSIPLYVAQVRSVFARAESRRTEYERTSKAARARYEEKVVH